MSMVIFLQAKYILIDVLIFCYEKGKTKILQINYRIKTPET